MSAPSTSLPRTGLLLAALAAAGPLAAQTTSPTPARPASPPAAALPAPAAPATGPWSLRRAVDYALEHNLGVRLNQLTARSNQQVLRQSKAALLPTANLNGTQAWNYGTSVNPLTYEFQSQTVRSNNFSAASQLVVFQGFQLRNTIRRNELDYQASLLDIEKARNDLSLNVASAFLQLVLAQELVRANGLYVQNTTNQIARSQLLLKAGSIPESTLLDSQSQLATDQLNVTNAQNQAAIARLNLLQLLNIDPATAQDFQIEVPALPDPDEENAAPFNTNEVFQAATTNLPEIKAADLRVLSARRSLDLARGAYYPRLFLTGSIFTGYSSSSVSRVLSGTSANSSYPVVFVDPVTGQPSASSYAVLIPGQPMYETLPVRFFNQLDNNLGKSVQFALQIPILNGLQVRTAVQRSIINEEAQRVRAEQARLTLRQTIEQANADARAAQLQYAASKRQVAALTLTQRNAEIRFNNGLLSGTEYNIIRNNLSYATSSQLNAKYTYIFRRKVLDFYLGKPLEL